MATSSSSTMLRHFLRAASLTLVASSISAQRPMTAAPPPGGWRWVTDTPASVIGGGDATDTSVVFSRMPPGWHMTTGPGFLAYDPRIGGTGRYAIELDVFHFPNPVGGEYGIFLGGRGLASRMPAYIAVLIRADGMVAVLERSGPNTKEIVPWVRHDSVKAQTAGGDPVRNVLSVDVEAIEVLVRVNGAEVARFARTAAMEGPFGIRAGKNVNLHVTRLDVTHRLAPIPR